MCFNLPSDCKKDIDCKNGACGLSSASEKAKYKCCSSGKTTVWGTKDYCTKLSDGKTCGKDNMCKSGYCKGNNSGLTRGKCFTRKKAGQKCPSKKNADCAGSLGCYRTKRYGTYKCCQKQCFCDAWDPGCTTGYYYCKSSGLGC